jgi:hypothetical protein
MRHDLEGEQTGAFANALVYRTLSFASLSIFGVVAKVSP